MFELVVIVYLRPISFAPKEYKNLFQVEVRYMKVGIARAAMFPLQDSA